jgi:hypothetical protein
VPFGTPGRASLPPAHILPIAGIKPFNLSTLRPWKTWPYFPIPSLHVPLVFNEGFSMTFAFRLKRFVVSFARLTRIWNLIIIAFAQYFTAAFLIDFSTVLDPRLFIL